MSDMPLPMPRWVMSSPIHISSAVPAVSVSTISSTRGDGRSWGPGRGSGCCAPKPPPPLWNRNTRPVDWMIAMADREVAGPLGDLALTDRALLLPLLELGDHHREDLHDDRAGDVRHDPEREDRELGERAAGEELEEGEHAALLGLVLERADTAEVDAGHRDVGTRAGRARCISSVNRILFRSSGTLKMLRRLETDSSLLSGLRLTAPRVGYAGDRAQRLRRTVRCPWRAGGRSAPRGWTGGRRTSNAVSAGRR